MGKNIIEKILAKTVGRDDLEVGEYLPAVRSPRPTHGTDTSGNYYRQLIELGAKIFDPKKIMIVSGHHGAGGSMGSVIGETRSRVRRQAKQLGVPDENIFDLGRGGIEHVVASEKCWPLPGTLYYSLIDGHVTLNGALGAMAVPISAGPGQPYWLAMGSIWLQVPEVGRIVLKGKLGKGIFVRDVVEHMISTLGPTANTGQVMEWAGPMVENMTMDERFTLCSNAIFTGAWTAIINPDKTTIDYVKSRSKEPFEPLTSDADAKYADKWEFDLSKLEPLIVPPPERIPAEPVSKYAGTKINKVFIGSCVNGRLEDMRLVAKMLKGKKVHRSVQLTLTPASFEIQNQCIKEGIMQVFGDAEVCTTTPCCSMCHGHNTPLGTGDVCLSTATHNHPGRAGSDKSDIYLCSPATAAASAITGVITDPREFL